jgi:hypothetical protein
VNPASGTNTQGIERSWLDAKIKILRKRRGTTELLLQSEPVGSRSSPAAGEQPEESPSPTWDFPILTVAVAIRVKFIMLFLPSTPFPYMVTVW